MLGKVFKYDMRALARLFFPLYIVLIALTIINKILLEINIINSNITFLQIIQTLFMTAYVITIIATGVVTEIFIIMNFYRSFLTDKAYLTMTLPVKPSTHINSKLFSGVIWNIISVLMVIVSLIIMIIGRVSFGDAFRYIGEILNEIFAVRGSGLLVFEIIMLVVASLFNTVLVFFVAMSIGQLMTKHKILGSVLSYVGIYFVNQIVATIILLVSGLGVTASYEESGVISEIPETYGLVDGMFEIQKFFLLLLIAQIIYDIIYYAVTYYFLSRKLNLE